MIDRTRFIASSSRSCLRQTLLVGFVRHEIHRHAVDAVALMGGRRAIVEDVPEMTAAGRAVDLGSYHAEGAIDRRLGRALDRLVEARPAGSALELALRLEQRRAATGAAEMAGRFSRSRAQLPGASVPCARITSYCSGVRIRRHSASLCVTG
jgi:hypothetical protein